MVIQVTAAPVHRFAEVLYYFQVEIHNTRHTLAMVCFFSAPDQGLLDKSLKTLIACKRGAPTELRAIDAHSICAVVSMPPLPLKTCEATLGTFNDDVWHYVVEKPGLDICQLDGVDEEVGNEGEGGNDEEDHDPGVSR